ncbi:cation diffusion facilitator family transporter [Streptomyces sp. UNOB3_S3]|uniref:cation diffusion facilitator family transporter n=1 Tax=Streptomyces sp. UNOB3_S3 TaxID=2871682 RepID=UPI001E4A6E58|nr:cation diffusion facilitator family transporter [Streptomyces sp. UNOB3_S3]MCC3776155.1 cation diffusion facilitator family transporter [Streptomyces sp. UNOB3_S3]
MPGHTHTHDHAPGGPAHSHDHGSGHGGHSHGVAADADRRWLTIALTLITVFMAVEVTIGVLARSLALISDAAHMLTDAASIVLALIAMRLAVRPARGGYTYGLKRAEILSAQANGLTLVLLAAWLGYEAVRRLINPPDVEGGLVFFTALAGIAVNIAAAWCISKANRSSLNVEGAFQHILNDLYAFIGTAVAGLVVMLTGFARADAIATLAVVALMLKAGFGLISASGRIFLEAAPAGIDPDAVGDRMAAADQVVEIHDLHIWQITSGQPALSAHVLVTPGGDCHTVRRRLQHQLREDYGITHATLQVDHLGEDQDEEALLQIAAPTGGRAHSEDTHGPVHRPGPHDH